MKLFLIIMIMFSFFSCMDGPRAAFNNEFERANPKVKLPYSNLIGMYVLDDDSKKRFHIQDTVKMDLQIKKDTSLVVNNYLDLNDRSLLNKSLQSKLYYINDFESIYLGLFNHKISSSGSLGIYYRKKDRLLALYIYISPLKGQEHGDYLRYIKVK
ncbi:hypothetical protein [Chryseobacterium lathyri]|uniref:hypothetical protein n=1 Tax=Chryseobacterium lathyri TaxID=395933 RepID=UPI001CC03EEB|nr:hypothetical protein [Chryseobacterium lathyri]